MRARTKKSATKRKHFSSFVWILLAKSGNTNLHINKFYLRGSTTLSVYIELFKLSISLAPNKNVKTTDRKREILFFFFWNRSLAHLLWCDDRKMEEKFNGVNHRFYHRKIASRLILLCRRKEVNNDNATFHETWRNTGNYVQKSLRNKMNF